MKYLAIILESTNQLLRISFSKLSLQKICCCLLALLFFLPLSIGQNRKSLESRRKKLLKNISITNAMLQQASKEKTANLNQYVALKNQIKNRKELLLTLRNEVELVDHNVDRTSNTISAMQADILRLKEEYKTMLQKAYRQKLSSNTLMYVLSAESFNQAFRRWQYLKQYHKYRKKQAKLIQETQLSLAKKINNLEIRKNEKLNLLQLTTTQANILQSELDDRNDILKTLRKDEKRLKKELRSHQYAHQKLNNAIESMIKKEMLARRRNARKQNSSSTASLPTTPSSTNLTSDFRGNKGRLPWPVKKGVIIKRFGKQAHPTIPKILISNNGIDILTDKKAAVHAVFEGSVVGTQFIPGQGNMLIIKHGNYYTVYSNLEELYVKRGEWIKKNQRIAKVKTDKKTKNAQVHFEVWRDKIRLNPADWVAKK